MMLGVLMKIANSEATIALKAYIFIMYSGSATSDSLHCWMSHKVRPVVYVKGPPALEPYLWTPAVGGMTAGISPHVIPTPIPMGLDCQH